MISYASASATGWDFSLANYGSVWSFVIQVCVLLLALLVGNLLRATIKPLRKALIPSSLIGGALLLIVLIILRLCIGADTVNTYMNKQLMQTITYHSLGLGFVAMSLKIDHEKKKGGVLRSVENGALTGSVYMLQAFVGILITVAFYFATKSSDNSVFYDAGLLLPFGFGQGPGNALTWDINFSNIIVDGKAVFEGNGSFGLTIASIGFLVASVVGVLYINIFKKKGQIQIVERGATSDLTRYESENEIEDTESVDKFSIQIGLVLLAYLLAFGIMFGLAKISSFTNSIAWGFNFLWGTITATLLKLLIKFFHKKNVIKRNYINNYSMDRISGFFFDLMIVAGVASIEIEDVKKYIWPLVALCVAGTVITFFYIRFVTKKRFPDLQHEMFAVNFGTLTGTASNGMILLKEVDPNLATPASTIFIQSQFSAMVFVAPLLLLASFSAKSLTNCLITAGITFVLFLGYNAFLFRGIFVRKKKDPAKTE